MQTLLAWIVLGCAGFASAPWAAWLLAQNPRRDGRWLTAALGLALSVGILALVMFWDSLLAIPFNVGTITLIYAALMLPGWVLWRRLSLLDTPKSAPKATSGRDGLLAVRIRQSGAFILLAVSGAVLFNAIYWPFYRPDAVGIYADTARQMTNLQSLVPLIGKDSLYRAYPVLIPLTYTYSYLASGWRNEYLARLAPALLSLGCLPVVYSFGRALRGETAGWLSAGLLAVTPMFARWASSGYVDLPMAFFYVLSAFFAWRLWQTGHWTDALLSGLLMGLAAFTKNAALLGIIFLGVWLLAGMLRRRISGRSAALCLGVCALVAAPWYIRNLIGAQMLIPPTAWTDQAERTVTTLLAFVTYSGNFGLPGFVILAGVMMAVAELARRSAHLAPELRSGYALLLLMTVPFFLAWWLFVSYDPRFLLLFLPLLAIMGGLALMRLGEWLPERRQKPLIVVVTLLAIILAASVVWNSIDFKSEMLRQPLMDDATKHKIVLTGP
jgi:4-amino-4-deoxy-L-arabinose transferase-like glycosyltransferase